MLSFLMIFSCVVSNTISLTITRDGYYDTKYNHLDIERVLNNKRLVMYYGQCLLGEGPCTPQGTEFKRILPEAMQTNCARCTEKQKVTAYLAIRRLKKEYPTIWQKMQANWDPSGELVSRFINDVETKSNLDGIAKIGNASGQQVVQQQQTANINNEVQQNIFNRIGDETTDNEINTGSSVAANQNQNLIRQTKAPAPSALPLQSAQVISNIQSVTAFNNQKNPNQIGSSGTGSQIIRDTSATATTTTTTTTERVPTTTFLNYRTTTRSNRVGLIPRPIDLGRLTVNVFAQVADVGTKVIRTGARIADMVLRPIFNNNNSNNNRN